MRYLTLALSYDPSPETIITNLIVVALILAVAGALTYPSLIPPTGKEIIWVMAFIGVLIYIAAAVHLFS